MGSGVWTVEGLGALGTVLFEVEQFSSVRLSDFGPWNFLCKTVQVVHPSYLYHHHTNNRMGRDPHLTKPLLLPSSRLGRKSPEIVYYHYITKRCSTVIYYYSKMIVSEWLRYDTVRHTTHVPERLRTRT